MRRRLAIRRILGLLIAVAAVVGSIYTARESERLWEESKLWPDARPMEVGADLSRPGGFAAPYRQTCGSAHARYLMLEIRLGLEPGGWSEEALRMLEARLVIQDARGEVVATAEIDKHTIYSRGEEGIVVLTDFPTFPKGDYTAIVLVRAGVSELAGREQLLYAKYRLCGLEQMPASLAGASAWFLAIVGFIAACAVLPGLYRHGLFTRGAPRADDNGAAPANHRAGR